MSDPFELVRAANPVPSPTAFPADARARITTAIVAHTRDEHAGGIVSALRRAARLRFFALAAGVMVVAGGTTAAIAVLSGQPSAPPSGAFTVPTGATQRGVSGAPTHYSITATPDLNGGAVGWCLQDHFYFGQGRYSGGGGCGHIQLADTAIVGVNAGSGSSLIGPLERRSRRLHYSSYSDLVYMTTARVAAVRVSPTLTIRTRADPQLPDGYRIAVAIHESITSVVAGQRPQRRSSSPNPFAVVPLDGAGRPIPSHLAPFPPPREPGAFWQAQPTSGVGPQPTLHRPPRGRVRDRYKRTARHPALLRFRRAAYPRRPAAHRQDLSQLRRDAVRLPQWRRRRDPARRPTPRQCTRSDPERCTGPWTPRHRRRAGLRHRHGKGPHRPPCWRRLARH